MFNFKNEHFVRSSCLVLGFATVMFSASASNVLAAKDCNLFAGAAMTRANENIQYGCGFQDSRYALDQTGHFNWCKNPAITEDQVLAELNFRRDQIQGCKAKHASLEAGCKSFAEQTVAKARINVQLGCGLGGGDYADDYNGHYQWCLNNGQIKASHQNKRTNIAIDACKADKQASDNHVLMCRNFAESAELKAIEAKKLNCGYTTGDYAIDYVGHYKWCLSATAAQATAQNQKTNAGIDACRAKQ